MRSGRFERPRATAAALAVAAAAFAVAVAPSSASTLDMDGPDAPSAQYRGGPGEANDVAVSLDGDTLVIRDAGAAIALLRGAQTACTLSPDAHEARCPARHGRYLSFDLRDGDDAIAVTLPNEPGGPNDYTTVEGGGGSDRMTVRAARAYLYGNYDDNGDPDPASGPDGADRIEFLGGAGLRRYERGTIVEEKITGADVDGGDGDDSIAVTGLDNRVYGGGGDDVIAGDDTHEPVYDPASCKGLDINGCVRPDPELDCLPNRNSTEILSGGPGDDRISGGRGPDTLTGGQGADTLAGGPHCDELMGDDWSYGYGGTVVLDETTGGNDVLDGGGLNDTLRAGLGDDALAGGDGDDELSGSPGADALRGGAGVDRTSYAGRVGPVHVTLNALPDDGEPGERDLVGADVDDVDGTPGNDILVGSPLANRLQGLAGDDVIVGGGGTHDFLLAGAGNDTIYAREGERGADWSPFAGLTFRFEDMVACDGGLGAGAGPSDVAFVDPEDGSGNPDSALVGCEQVVFSDNPVYVDPTTESLPVPTPCDAGPVGTTCNGVATVRVPVAGGLGSSRYRPAAKWRTLGKRGFVGRRGTRKRIRVPVSRKAVRRTGGGKRVKAYVTFRYSKKKRR